MPFVYAYPVRATWLERNSHFIRTMSTQSGIRASQELVDASNSLDGPVLVITLSDDATQLVEDVTFAKDTGADTESVLQSLQSHFSANYPSPRFAIVSVNDTVESRFISFIPDVAPIRQKMLFASTKNTLLQQLGTKFSKHNVLDFSELEELELASFKRATASHNEEQSLTSKEKELQTLDSLQNLTLSQSAYKRELPLMNSASGSSLFFKIEPKLDLALRSNLKSKLVVMNIDTAAEELNLTAEVSDVPVSLLISEATKAALEASPMYMLYGHDEGKLAFIYSCPSGCKVKARIMYAANKQGLLSHLKTDYLEGAEISEILEVGDLDEINTSVLDKASAAAPESSSLRFSKPKGPRRR